MGLQSQRPLVSVIIPNFNGAAYLERCLASLARQTYEDVEVIIVDNASSDGSVELIRRVAPDARLLLQTQNLGFAGGLNAGIQAASGEIIAVLNNDTEVSPTWLAACAAAFDRYPEAGFLACRILEFSQRDVLYSAGDCFLRGGIGYRRGQEQRDRPAYHMDCPVFSACGCAALYRKALLHELGGFDRNFFAYLEDVDLGLRLQAAGYMGFYIGSAEVYHLGGGTSGGEFSALSVRLRTRNAILLLLKNMPAWILLRCSPMIILTQIFWLGRTLTHGKMIGYLAGWTDILRRLPEIWRCRRQIQKKIGRFAERIWHAIRDSENMARTDVLDAASENRSLFLKWYFRLF
jgi:GT2 family glycosyltransferase